MKNQLKLRFLTILTLASILLFAAGDVWAKVGSTGSRTTTLSETAGEMPIIVTDGINSDGDLVLTIEEDGRIGVQTDGKTVYVAQDEQDTNAVEAEGGDHGAKEAPGFPQLDPRSYSSQIFWLFVSFVALYTLMSRLALPRVTEVLDMRQTQKNGNIDRAEQLQEEAEKIRTAYEVALGEAHDKAEDAMKQADQAIADKASAEATRFGDDARKRVVEAEARILAAKTKALDELTDISADVAADIVNKITDIKVQKADAQKAVQTALKNAA